MPVVPDIDPETVTLSELAERIRAFKEHHAAELRNIAFGEAMIARGQQSFPMGACPDCPADPLPIRDDDTIECPNHGVIPGDCPHTMGHEHH